MKNVYIIGAKRTPTGSFQGVFNRLSAIDLGSTAIASSLDQANIKNTHVNEVYMGCVLTAGLGQSPARQASIKAGIPVTTPSTTINKVCGSGMKSVIIATESLSINNENIIVSGGMESMSNAPYILKKARNGYRLGHEKVLDHIMIDGLEDAYNKGYSMGYIAEETAEKYNISRKEQDYFAEQSIIKAHNAKKNNSFKNEISPVQLINKKGEHVTVSEDEVVSISHLKKISRLKPVFKQNGTITAANSSSINDGAASLVLAGEEAVFKNRLRPMAKVVAFTTTAQDPSLFAISPIESVKKVAEKASWDLNSVDIFEINEAFAVVTIIAIKELRIDPSKVNIFGGACALGHPIGASGSRIIVTLINSLIKTKGKRGIASVCIGGGESTAIAIEIV